MDTKALTERGRFEEQMRKRWPASAFYITPAGNYEDGEVDHEWRLWQLLRARASAPPASAEPVALTDKMIAEAMLAVDDPLLWGRLGVEKGNDMVRKFAHALIALAAPPAQDAAPPEPAPASQAGVREALGSGDVFFLVGVAHGPYLDGLTEIPVALLEVAGKISATLGDRAMVRRCGEMAERIKNDALARAALSQPTQAQEKDAALLDAMQANPRWHLDCEVLKFGKPGKWRVWKLLGNQMHSTSTKVLGEGDTPRAAIDSAIAASTAKEKT
jgi:hypothetical protein